MSGIGIVDASPLIVLSRVGRSNLLTRAFDEVWIPESVASEVAAGPEDDPARELLATGFGRVAGAGLRLCDGSPGVSRRRSNPGHPSTNPKTKA